MSPSAGFYGKVTGINKSNMARESESQGRMLTSTKVGEYTLLNSEKLGRVLDLLEGIKEPVSKDEAAVLVLAKEMKHEQAVLALYDRLGGGIKLKERKVATGTFYDFAARKPRVKAKVDEGDFNDEYVLVKKKANKGKKVEDIATRIKRIEKAQV